MTDETTGTEAAAPPELAEMLSEVGRCWSESLTPEPLRLAFLAWNRQHKSQVDRLRALLAAATAWWIVGGREAGHDPAILEQVGLQTTLWAAAVISRAAKLRQGAPFAPGRLAIVAWAVAHQVAQQQASADIEGLARAGEDLIDGLDAAREMEHERLRNLIADIADMDLGETEMEHREIVARCRAEVERWERASATELEAVP